MARRKQTEEKKNVITSLIEAYDIKTTCDLQEALKDLMGGTIQEMLEAELDEHMGYDKYESTEISKTNYRNGHKPKTLKSTVGKIDIEVPQDRNSEFEPKIIPKYKTNISEIEQKIINSYRKIPARGASSRVFAVGKNYEYTPEGRQQGKSASKLRIYTVLRPRRKWLVK